MSLNHVNGKYQMYYHHKLSHMKKIAIVLLIITPVLSFGTDKVETWDYYEVILKGPKEGNPFKDIQLKATFTSSTTRVDVNGFYNGNGIYIIRFMPGKTGVWEYVTKSNTRKLSGKKGKFECIPAAQGNHGMVEVEKKYHFRYSDGTPYYPFGTTCYAWTSQSDSLQEQTLKTLSTTPFNKVRMCVFPKTMFWKRFDNPPLYAYEGTPPNDWDFYCFNPVFFEKLEQRILQLRDMGIECDLIIFHPYDKGRWGFDSMSDDQDDFYLNYLIARLSSFRNIWWSVANEFDVLG